jgi:hypothetical protein
MTKVNPVQTTTYYLNAANNPIIFGAGTNVDVSSGSGIGVYGSNVRKWAVTNQGAISGHLYGVDLAAGGSVANKAGATIAGGHAGVYGYYYLALGAGVRILGGPGTVTNAGEINSSGAYGVELGAGGSVTNEAGATISSAVFGNVAGIDIAGGAGKVTNAGDISGFFIGVYLQAGGSFTNKSGGTINAGIGVQLKAGGSVANKAGGTINGGISLSAGGSVTNGGTIHGFDGVDLTAGGSVTNQAGATIATDSGGRAGIRALGVATVSNAGEISGSDFANIGWSGVGLYAGGSVINKAGATITAPYAVYVNGGAGTVTNAGDITGQNNSLGTTNGSFGGFWGGVLLGEGGSVTNKAGATISGFDFGVAAKGNAAAVMNAGDISGKVGVVTTASPATVTNSGAITGTEVGSHYDRGFGTIRLGDGVFMDAGGALTNNVGGTITGAGDGVYIAGGGSVTNAGEVSGSSQSGVGVYLAAGGSVANKAGATISGYYGVKAFYGTVTNAGEISGADAGVGMATGSVTNEAGATISANNPFVSYGVSLVDGGTVTNGAGATISAYSSRFAAGVGAYFGLGTLQNYGNIVSNGYGVTFHSGGVVNNGKGGTISGTGVGVRLDGAGRVTNAGAISGAAASVQFAGAGANTLTLKTGSTLSGDAIGSTASGATNALILQGHGTADNNFDDFDTLSVQANGNWTLGGDSTFGATTVSSGSLIVAGDVSGGPTTLGDPAGDVAKLVIASTGTWDILDDSSIGLGGCTPSFLSNSGLFEKTGGTGTSAIAPAAVNKGTIEVTVGTLDLQGPVTGKGTAAVSGAATLEFDSTVAATQTIDFLGGPSAVDLIDPNGFLGRIAGFASSDTVQLSGDWVFCNFAENSAGTLATLTLANGASHHAFNFVGDYAATDFKVASGATTTISHA